MLSLIPKLPTINLALPEPDLGMVGMPLMENPSITLGAVGFYLLFILWLGPRLMSVRAKPFDLRGALQLYNTLLVVASLYMTIEFANAGWFWGTYSLGCQPVDGVRENGLWLGSRVDRVRLACWVYFASKLVELLDTVFFILRKKYNQVTVLHVYHHAIMPITWWYFAKYMPGGFSTFHAMINSFVHVVMYSYYGLASLGPSIQPYLWWKKYLTLLQIGQFVLVITHCLYVSTINDCAYPELFVYWVLLYAVIFLVLFVNFYLSSYQGKKSQPSGKTVNGGKASMVDNGKKGM